MVPRMAALPWCSSLVSWPESNEGTRLGERPSWLLDKAMRREYGEFRRWRLSCLTVKIPAHKMGVTLEGQAGKIRESLRG